MQAIANQILTRAPVLASVAVAATALVACSAPQYRVTPQPSLGLVASPRRVMLLARMGPGASESFESAFAQRLALDVAQCDAELKPLFFGHGLEADDPLAARQVTLFDPDAQLLVKRAGAGYEIELRLENRGLGAAAAWSAAISGSADAGYDDDDQARMLAGAVFDRLKVDGFWPSCAAHATAVPAPRPPRLNLGMLLGMTFGGDTLVVGQDSSGDFTITAGGGFLIQAVATSYLLHSDRHALGVELDAGVKFDQAGGEDADYQITFLRVPLSPRLLYDLRLSSVVHLTASAGPQLEGLAPHLSTSGAAVGAGIDTDFDTALGWTVEAGLRSRGWATGWLSLRYTAMRYSAPGLVTVSGDSFGVVAGTTFTTIR